MDVIAVFEKGTLKPIRFRWKGQTYKIARVTGRWKAPKGEAWLRYYAVVDSNDNVFQLVYDERHTGWMISKVWVE